MKLRHVLAVLLSFAVPGSGHIAEGRPGRGLLVFFLFGFAIDAWFYAQAQSILPSERALATVPLIRLGAIGLGALLWAFGVLDTAAIALRRRRILTKADVATAHIRNALVACLRDDFPAAAKALQAARRIDDQDPDVLFHLGVVYAGMGQTAKARRAFRGCIRYDHDGKWDTEAQRQLRALESAPNAPAPAPPQAKEEGPR